MVVQTWKMKLNYWKPARLNRVVRKSKSKSPKSRFGSPAKMADKWVVGTAKVTSCIPKNNDIKICRKTWEKILFSQIPKQLVEFYKDEKEDEEEYIHDVKLTRGTANNVAAWLMCEYETHKNPGKFFNFSQEMRDSFYAAHLHPLNDMADLFDGAPESDTDEYTQYKVAKKMFASQYPPCWRDRSRI